MLKYPDAALRCGLLSVTASKDSTESYEKLLPSINNLHINVMNAQATAYTADLLLNMKANSPTNANTLVITNQLHHTLQKTIHHPMAFSVSGGGIAAKESEAETEAGGAMEDDSAPSSLLSLDAASTESFKMLPPKASTNSKDKPIRVATSATNLSNAKGVKSSEDGLVSSGKVSFSGGHIRIPSHSDVEVDHHHGNASSITPALKLSEDGTSTKKRLKEATPRKVSKTKSTLSPENSPHDDEDPDDTFPDPSLGQMQTNQEPRPQPLPTQPAIPPKPMPFTPALSDTGEVRDSTELFLCSATKCFLFLIFPAFHDGDHLSEFFAAVSSRGEEGVLDISSTFYSD